MTAWCHFASLQDAKSTLKVDSSPESDGIKGRNLEDIAAGVTKDVAGGGGGGDKLHDYVSNSRKELEDKVLYLQREADITDMTSKKEVESLQRKLDAVFQSTAAGQGNQSSDAVATKQGAIIDIVNPVADEQMSELRLTLMQLQEKLDSTLLQKRDCDSNRAIVEKFKSTDRDFNKQDEVISIVVIIITFFL